MAEDGYDDMRLDLDGAGEALADLERRANSFGTAIGNALKSAAVEGRSLEDVLRALGSRMSAIALDAGLAPLEKLVAGAASNLTAGLGRLLPFANGGVPGRIIPFADGGVVGGPTLFPMASGETGLMGEAGSEAILPLARGPDGRLGVASARGQAPVHVTFNVSTPDAGSFRKSETQISAMLARAVQRGRRGL